ncbi:MULTISPECIES: 4'-phosphopantetheinyl transferase family protein [unclassified Nocardioides]|uniref:4'-phosphopantetheinyl transferase family protein n=1 Tax=unclassified Nocardioides TaxID=2615069 RepID=UPI00138F32A0|nr:MULTISPECIES: 4'-phosphopantetheinyl transferase superfamily protein [unclassified Nocardioides]
MAVRETFEDADPELVLMESERAQLGRVGEERAREFATARACARAALSDIGHPPVPLLRGEHGHPDWPHGVVGSLTHCRGYRAAAVAPAAQWRAVGIDAEPHEPLPEGVLSFIASPEESALVAQLMAARRGIHWDTVLFSAKESIYKAWFAFTGERLGFGDARVVIDGSRRTFAARILAAPSTGQGRRLPRRDDGVSGRIGVSRGLVLTAVSIGWGRSSSEPPAFRDERAS